LSPLSTLSTGKRAQIPFVRIGRDGQIGISRSRRPARKRDGTSKTPPVPRGPISFGKEARDALVGQPGRSARQRGNLKPNPLFRSPAGPEPSGKGLAKGRPESLLEGTTAPASKGSPGEERTVGKPGSPGGKEPNGQSPACRKDVQRMVAGLPERRSQDGRRFAGKTSDRRKRGLPRGCLKGWSGACFGYPGSSPAGACFGRTRLGTDRGRETPAGT
jgi:hypothetical protein